MNEDIKEHIYKIVKDNDDIFTKYTDTHKMLSGQFTSDDSRAKAYRGRELLELLQNVDDAYEDHCKKNPEDRGKPLQTSVEYIENVFRVSNYGTEFSKDSINRLCQGGVSNKGKEYIGNKGIGFRSLLNWASEIHLWSGEYAICFSEEFSKLKTKELFEKYPALEKEREIIPDLSYPILSAPQPYEKDKKADYNTVIEVILKPESLDNEWNLANQLLEFRPEVLLFLPNITQINFNNQNDIYSYKKESGDEENLFHIKKLNKDGVEIEKSSYYVFDRKDKINETLLKMSLAIPDIYNPEIVTNNCFFTFFPIRDAYCPFPALLHSTFELNQSRDSIERTDINKEVMKRLLSFYVETVTSFFTKLKYGNYALKLLVPCRKPFLPSPFNQTITEEAENTSKIDYYRYYLDLCSEKKFLLNVNEEFLSPRDKIKVLKEFPRCFRGEPFRFLLNDITIEEQNFVRELSQESLLYSEDELRDNINAVSEFWSLEDRVNTFFWWLSYFKNFSELPHLLRVKNRINEWVSMNKSCFFSAGKFEDIPNWAKITLLNEDEENLIVAICKENYSNELKAKSKKDDDEKIENNKRLTIRFLSEDYNIPFKEFVTKSLISPINESIGDSYSNAIDFVNWLYKYYDEIKTSGSSLIDIDYAFPGVDGKVHPSSELYLGMEYDNEFGARIFEHTNYTSIPGIETFSFDEKDSAKQFFIFFKVLELPPMAEGNPIYLKDEYEQYVTKEIKRRFTEKKVSSVDTEVYLINDIEGILNNLTDSQIVEWLLHEQNGLVYSKITNKISEKSIKFFYGAEWTKRSFSSPISSYLKFVLSNTKWLTINGEKKSPNQCLISDSDKLARYIPCITSDYIKELSLNSNKIDVEQLLDFLGAKKKVVDLNSENYYGLLLSLQGDDSTKDISTQIYRQSVIEFKDYKELEIFEESNAKKEFFEKGKVWSKTHNKYTEIKDTYFYGSATLNISNKSLIALPLRTGSKEIVEKLYGVKEYIESYQIANFKISPVLDDEFKKYIKNFISYVFCYRMDDAKPYEIEKFQKLDIHLVQYIALKDSSTEDKEIPVREKYKLLTDEKSENTFYITIGDDTEITIDNYSSSIEQILAILINTQNKEQLFKYSQLFESGIEKRKKILSSDFEDVEYSLERSSNILNGMISDKALFIDYLNQEDKMSVDIQQQIDSISFAFFDSLNNQKKLYALLKIVEVDVSTINTLLRRSDITIKKALEEQLELAVSKYEFFFKYSLRNYLITQDLEKQKKFIQNCYEYDNFRLDVDILDSIYFDAKEVLSDYFRSNNLIFNPEEKNPYNYKNFYADNQKKLLEDGISEITIDKFLKASESNYSLFFFEYDVLKNTIEIFSKNSEKSSSINNNGTNSSGNPGELKGKKIIPRKKGGKRKPSFVSPELKVEDDKIKVSQGDKAEEAVYEALKLKQISEVNNYFGEYADIYVDWCSAAAKRKQDLPPEDSDGYDIKIVDRNTGKFLYVEVKSSSSATLSFEMSINEYTKASAQENIDKYMVIFVANVDLNKEISLQDIHPLPFNLFYSDDYKIEPSHYNVFLVEK